MLLAQTAAKTDQLWDRRGRNNWHRLGEWSQDDNSVYIEGILNREPQNAYIGLTPPIEGIQEVQVYTGKYNAEFGFSGSAVINIVTKSGTDKFHGSLFEFLRNNATDAKNYFATDANRLFNATNSVDPLVARY